MSEQYRERFTNFLAWFDTYFGGQLPDPADLDAVSRLLASPGATEGAVRKAKRKLVYAAMEQRMGDLHDKAPATPAEAMTAIRDQPKATTINLSESPMPMPPHAPPPPWKAGECPRCSTVLSLDLFREAGSPLISAVRLRCSACEIESRQEVGGAAAPVQEMIDRARAALAKTPMPGYGLPPGSVEIASVFLDADKPGGRFPFGPKEPVYCIGPKSDTLGVPFHVEPADNAAIVISGDRATTYRDRGRRASDGRRVFEAVPADEPQPCVADNLGPIPPGGYSYGTQIVRVPIYTDVPSRVR